MPIRIQRERTPGWTKPEGAIYVGRSRHALYGKWGNPFRIVPANGGWSVTYEGPDGIVGGTVGGFATKREAARYATDAYRQYVKDRPELLAAIRRELAGRDLMCWCPLIDASGVAVPCHADVLLEIANGGAL